MKFCEYLKEKRTELGLKSSKDLYAALGGEKKLGVAFRQFQNLESGKNAPTIDVISRIFNLEPAAKRHEILRAFFNSHLEGKSEGQTLLKYASKHLTQALEEGSFDWDTKPHRPYSESQLDFFLQNPDAMRFHRRLVLAEKVAKSKCTLSNKVLQQMRSLELVEEDTKFYKPFINRYRLPKFGEANPRLVSRGHDFIAKNMELFLSKEGSQQQELAYAFQMVEPHIANTAREQLRLLKEWIQTHVSPKTIDQDPNLVPLIFVGFCKALERFELE